MRRTNLGLGSRRRRIDNDDFLLIVGFLGSELGRDGLPLDCGGLAALLSRVDGAHRRLLQSGVFGALRLRRRRRRRRRRRLLRRHANAEWNRTLTSRPRGCKAHGEKDKKPTGLTRVARFTSISGIFLPGRDVLRAEVHAAMHGEVQVSAHEVAERGAVVNHRVWGGKLLLDGPFARRDLDPVVPGMVESGEAGRHVLVGRRHLRNNGNGGRVEKRRVFDCITFVVVVEVLSTVADALGVGLRTGIGAIGIIPGC